MSIRIYHHHLDARPLDLQAPDGNCNVVKHTIAFAMFPKRMMSSSSKNDGGSILQSCLAGQSRCLDLNGASLVKLGGQGKPQPDLLLPIQLA